MTQTQTPIGYSAGNPSAYYPNASYVGTSESILDRPSASVVEIALQALQEAGMRLVEWDVLLRARMNVPRVLFNFSYLVPDDRLEDASDILTSIDLPLSRPSDVLLKTQGDLYAKGRFYRITRSTLPCLVCHIVLYPFSLAAFSPSELSEQRPSHLSPSLCSNILVPSPSAVCAFIMRAMTKYPRSCSTRTILDSDLGELVLYFFLGYTLQEMNKVEEEEEDWEDEDRRITAASQIVKQWCLDKEWRQGEEWIGDALAVVVTGGKPVGFPCS